MNEDLSSPMDGRSSEQNGDGSGRRRQVSANGGEGVRRQHRVLVNIPEDDELIDVLAVFDDLKKGPRELGVIAAIQTSQFRRRMISELDQAILDAHTPFPGACR